MCIQTVSLFAKSVILSYCFIKLWNCAFACVFAYKKKKYFNKKILFLPLIQVLKGKWGFCDKLETDPTRFTVALLLLSYCELLDLYMWKSNLSKAVWPFYSKGIIHLDPCIWILKYSRPWVALNKWYCLNTAELKGDVTFLVVVSLTMAVPEDSKGSSATGWLRKNNRTVFLSALSCEFLNCECSQLWVQPSDQKELDDSFKSTDFQSTKPLPKLTVMRFIRKWWRT